MIYTVIYSQDAKETLAKFKRSNPGAFKKVMKFINELHEHPRTGTGHPEPLINGNSITYSRSVTKKDRLVYDIDEDEKIINVLWLEGHYDDK